MAAKRGKNTLKDLIKLQASQDDASAEAPETGEKKDYLNAPPKTLVKVSRLEKELQGVENSDEAFLLTALRKQAELQGVSAREVLYRLIETLMAEEGQLTAHDLMLLNTVQYLHHTERLQSKLDEIVG